MNRDMNEFVVRRIVRPNMPIVYRVQLGQTVILELASVPSDDDIRTALRLHRDKAAINERQPSR